MVSAALAFLLKAGGPTVVPFIRTVSHRLSHPGPPTAPQMTLPFEVTTSPGWISTSSPDGSQAPRRMRTSPTKGISRGSKLWSVWFLFRGTVRLGETKISQFARGHNLPLARVPRAGDGQALQSVGRLSSRDG